jgi:hypothetical protein
MWVLFVKLMSPAEWWLDPQVRSRSSDFHSPRVAEALADPGSPNTSHRLGSSRHGAAASGEIDVS